jgi:hypothetical protein
MHADGNTMNIKKLKLNIKMLTESYKSNGIFNFKSPLITDILKPYVDKNSELDSENVGEINDYKVFYLFGNYAESANGILGNMKCEHQRKLLVNTKDFIDVITKN